VRRRGTGAPPATSRHAPYKPRGAVGPAVRLGASNGELQRSCSPARRGRLDDVRRNVRDVLVGEAAAEGRHGTLAIGDLLHHSLLVETAVQVLLQGILLERLLRHDDVLAASVARSAVSGEHGLARSRVAREGRRCNERKRRRSTRNRDLGVRDLGDRRVESEGSSDGGVFFFIPSACRTRPETGQRGNMRAQFLLTQIRTAQQQSCLLARIESCLRPTPLMVQCPGPIL